MIYGGVYDSPLGVLLLACSEAGITSVWFERQKHSPEPVAIKPHPHLKKATAWLDAYFSGERPDCKALSLDMHGTVFMRGVWNLLLNIPWGSAVSYGEIAAKAGSSPRAVGNAIGRNPIGIIVPCHRVIGKNGDLTGYAGGLERKIWLLEHEGVTFRRPQKHEDKASLM